MMNSKLGYNDFICNIVYNVDSPYSKHHWDQVLITEVVLISGANLSELEIASTNLSFSGHFAFDWTNCLIIYKNNTEQ